MEFDVVSIQLGRYADAMLALSKDIKLRVTDVRIKIGAPVMLCCLNEILFLTGIGCASSLPTTKQEWVVTQNDVEELFYRFCGYAVYSHTDELKHGFISLDRKFRVGVSGTAVIENGKFQTVRNITSLTIRIPRDVYGCSDVLYKAGVRPEQGVLLAGAPSSGKTTLLRDFARTLGSKKRVAVLDERFELRSDGYDLGLCSDVLQGYPKQEGVSHALRCLSPQYILCDELEEGDIPAIQSAFYAGVSFIATVHAGSKEELCKRSLCRNLIESNVFGYIVLLKGRCAPTEIQCVYKAGELLENSSNIAFDRMHIGNRIYRVASTENACS